MTGSVLHLLTEGLDGVRRVVMLIKVEAASFEGTVGNVDIGIILDNLFRVSLVKAGSPAHMSGQVAQYDKLLAIDGEPVSPSLTRQEVSSECDAISFHKTLRMSKSYPR